MRREDQDRVVKARRSQVIPSRLPEGTMNTIRTAGTLALGAALLAGCTERSTPTAPSDSRAIALSAVGQTMAVDDPTGDGK